MGEMAELMPPLLDYLIMDAGGAAHLDAGVAPDGRLDRPVPQKLPEKFVAAGMRLEEQLGGQVAELMRG